MLSVIGDSVYNSKSMLTAVLTDRSQKSCQCVYFCLSIDRVRQVAVSTCLEVKRLARMVLQNF